MKLENGVVSMSESELTALKTEERQAGITEGKGLGATEERERIKSVEEQAMPGHEALIATMKFDGKTTGPEAAVKVLQAERAAQKSRLDALHADGKEASVAPTGAPSAKEEEDKEKESEQSATKSHAEIQASANEIRNYVSEQKKSGRVISFAQAQQELAEKANKKK